MAISFDKNETVALAKAEGGSSAATASKANKPAANSAAKDQATNGNGNGSEYTADTYPIDDDIAIPVSATKKGKVSKYPWERLNIGQSFFVPNGKRATFYTACAKQSKNLSKLFKCAEFTSKEGVEGVRVFRTE